MILVCSALVQIGLAPYDCLFPAYLTRLASSTYAGVAVAVGAMAELAFMLSGARIVQRVGNGRVFVIACGSGLVRWGLMAVTTSPVALIALQLFHALGFGAFYLSAVALVDEESPLEVRASAQGIFNAVCFGIGAAASLSWAGFIEPFVGLRGVFAIGSVASAFAALLAIKAERALQPA
jgi:PPP family 3-phenylpropionic acid transporter